MAGDASRSNALCPPDRCCRNSAGVAENAEADCPSPHSHATSPQAGRRTMMHQRDGHGTPNLRALFGTVGASGFSRAAVSPCGDESDIIELSLCGDEGGDG